MDAVAYVKGNSAGSKGIDFQVNLSTVFLLNALRTLENWKLSTENEKAAKFDDVVLELSDKSAILLQAKFKERGKITVDQLFSTNSKKNIFGLPKYFFSYREVKEKFLIKAIVLCTNSNIEEGALELLTLHEVDSDSMLHYEDSCYSFYTFNEGIVTDLKEKIVVYHSNNLQGKGIDEAIITDKNVKDFLKHLRFYTSYPAEKEMEKVIQSLLYSLKHSNKLWCHASPQDVHNKMMEWFQQHHGYYLTEIRAKAMFCDIKTDHYCQILDNYNVVFKQSGLTFPDTKRIFHFATKDGYLLQAIQIYQALKSNKSKTLYVCPEDGIDVQNQVIESFQLPNYTLLVIIQPKAAEESETMTLSFKLNEALEKFDYKKIAFVCEERNKLLEQVGISDDSVEVINETVIFDDLTNDTQNKLMERRNISFQGTNVNLKEIFSETKEDFDTAIDTEVLEKLVRDETISIGTEVRLLDEKISCYYIDRKFLRKNKEDENSTNETYSEQDIFNVKEKAILITDVAGMGKTTVLAKLARRIKEKNPHLWVIRIELNDRTKFLKSVLGKNRETFNITALLGSKKSTELKNKLERSVFAMNKKVVLMFDGVDEISPDYTQLILHLLSECNKASNVAKIFVTARPHMANELKDELQVEPFTLRPFSKKNQIEFLKSYWSYNLKLNEENQSRSEQYAQALIKKMSGWVKLHQRGKNHFAAIPLQVRMLAEIYQQRNSSLDKTTDWVGCMEYLGTDKLTPNLPEKVNITKLYGMFVDSKRSVFLDKGNPTGNPAANQALMEQYNDCLISHRTLALETILEKEERELFSCYLKDAHKVETNILKIGIVQKVNEEFHFAHRTFAEYFLAECLIMELKLRNPSANFQKFLIDEVFSSHKFSVVRAFLDSFLQEIVATIPSTIFRDYQSLKFRVNFKTSSNLIHNLAREGCVPILRLILKCIGFKVVRDRETNIKDTYTSTFTKIFKEYVLGNTLNVLQFLTKRGGVNIKDGQGRTPLHYAVWSRDLETSKFLVEKGANIEAADKYGCVVLYEAITEHYVDIVAYFLESILSSGGVHRKDPMLLYTAAYAGRLDVVTALIEQGCNVNSRIVNEETSIFGAVHGEVFSVVEYLVKKGADINCRDMHGNTVVRLAALRESLDILKLLARSGADLNVRDNKGHTALHLAAAWGQLEVAELLVELDANVDICDNDGRTALHLAAETGKLDTVKFLARCGLDINVRDNNGQTVLDVAFTKHELDIVKFLLESGVDVKIRNNAGFTIQHSASKGGELEIVKVLVDRGEDMNIRDAEGRTALHLASMEGQLSVVEFLAGAGADLNVIDNKAYTALHLSSLWDQWELVKFLVQFGVDVNLRNNNGYSALHLAVEKGNLGIVKLLVEHGADVNVVDNGSQTALYLAVLMEQLNMVEFLLGNGANVNVRQNLEGYAALHLAAKKSHTEAARSLVEHGADLKIVDKNRRTPLHLAILGDLSYTNEFLVEMYVDPHATESDTDRDCNLVKLLIERGADANAADSKGRTALHLAVLSNQTFIVEFLLEVGVNVNIRDNEGCTALHSAIRNSYLGIAKLIIQHEGDTDINVTDNKNRTPMHLLAASNQWDLVEYLVGNGADLNIRDSGGYTVLHLAVENGRLPMVELLVEYGADTNVTDKNRRTSLQLAALWDQLHIIEFLVGREVDVNVRDNNGYTALHLVAEEGRLGTVKFLVKHGVDVDIIDNNKRTAMHLAASWGRWDMVEFLVTAGANVNIRDNNGCTPLHFVTEDGHLDTIKMLIEHGADVTLTDNNNLTPLHVATLWDQRKTMRCIVQLGVDVSTKNEDGCTALHLAVKWKKLHTMKFLMELGVDVNVRDNDGRTALHYAVLESQECVKFLVKQGADVSVVDNNGDTVMMLARKQGDLHLLKYLDPRRGRAKWRQLLTLRWVRGY